MPTYQVFVEGPSDGSPGAVASLASAMAARYGLPAAELGARLADGRFRVKASVDRDTAERFAADLERLGAVVSIVDERGAVVRRAEAATPAPKAPAPVTRAPAPKPPAPAPAPKPPAPGAGPQFQSGLAAAFGARSDDPDLGALGGDSGQFALSALDGSDDHPVASGSFAPPDAGALPASIGPAALPASIGPAALPASIGPAALREPSGERPLDLFAPPDAEAPVELAVDVVERPRRSGTVSAPPPGAPQRVSGRITAPPPDPFAAPAPAPASLGDRVRGWAGNRRARFAAGALLTVLLGFAPAALVASVREHAAFAEIDSHLRERQGDVHTIDEWNELDQVRATYRDEKIAEKHSIALGSIMIWAAVSAAFAFVWFRKIDWDRFAR